MTRTDAHSPTNMDPADYQYVAAFDNGAPGFLVNVDMDWWRSITNWPKATEHRGTHQCHHCGARIRYFAIMKHLPTGEHIAIGETCLDNRFELESKAQFDALRKAAALDRQKQRIKTAVLEWLEHQSPEVVEVFQKDSEIDTVLGGTLSAYAKRVLLSMKNNLWRYGELTEKQLAFAHTLIAEAPAKHAEQERIAAERAAEVLVPAPEGKGVDFEGVVIKTVTECGDYGWYTKLTIKVTTTEGVWLVWVTEPKALAGNGGTLRGDVVRMRANLTRSNRDAHFAFGKRPSQAQLIERPSEAPEIDALAD